MIGSLGVNVGEPCADFEARGAVSDLRAAHMALATDYWGMDGTNGHRSRSTAAQVRLRALDEEFHHYMDRTRFETCIGVEALKRHESEHDKVFSESVAVQVAEIQARANRTTQGMILGGVLITALINLMMKFI